MDLFDENSDDSDIAGDDWLKILLTELAEHEEEEDPALVRERVWADEDAHFFDEMVPPYELERRGVEEDDLLDDTELEDLGSTRAARKVAREKYRFNTGKSSRDRDPLKSWKRACRCPSHRSRRWIAQWEPGVATRHERMLKPIVVELQELEWHHVPNWGMRARVVGWQGVGKVAIPRASWIFRSNRTRPLDHELWELDALQERAWNERERMRDRVRELEPLEWWELDVFETLRERFAG